MRKGGQKPIQRPIENTAAATRGTRGFQGFKIASAAPATRNRPSALVDFDVAPDTEPQADSDGRPIGKSMSLSGTHGKVIRSTQELDSQQGLVIPVKRNAERWKKDKGRQDDRQEPVAGEPGEPPTLREQAIRSLTSGDGGLGDAAGDRETYGDEDEDEDEDVDQDTYERVPVEMFGAAMLRGMGWRDDGGAGKGNGSGGGGDAGVSKPRPSLLGLGARARPVHEEEEERDRASGSRRKIKKF
ncbi:hypothetical protein LPJ56_000521 [Coemansia sp. RSA 2599]|nr:hypothetical protein LPJ75_000209 [Coemansia sp. RSA 2598]KAJ1829219.1 hypothetical protein LPJ56_000521 [Coemansia sp. RSA 2599]